MNITNDSPFAERLDRNYFGFDQDYFERMPLLVNALQESNYVDTLLEISRPISRKRYNKSITTTKPTLTTDMYRYSKIKRTSPRPFIFEYRSPTPLPFSKTYGSRSWVDSYRNAQRLQNIRQVIKYLEKTINAKMGDMYSKPSDTHTSIAFSGVYVEPIVDKLHTTAPLTQISELQQQSSNKVETFHSNHQSDPLFNFKPNSPGDVNLLAEGLWRFSPIPTLSTLNDKGPNVPMFKKIPLHKKFCIGSKCNENDSTDSKVVDLLQSSTEQTTEATSPKPKSFSVMLNLYPLKSNVDTEYKNQDIKTPPPVENIYFTTSKPVRFQFRRKSNLPVRRNYYRYKKPKYLVQKKNEMESNHISSSSEKPTPASDLDIGTKMVVHVNVYSPEEKTELRKKMDTVTEPTTSTTQVSTYIPVTETPFEISSGKVEDFHAGSSGVIPVHERTEPPVLPQVTTMIPFFDTDTASTDINSWSTSNPEVIKFSPEDAKVPDHYLKFNELTTTQVTPTEMSRRTFIESSTEREELETLIIRLKNDAKTTTSEKTTEPEEKDEDEEHEEKESTTKSTYVPQINGHYRSFTSKNSTGLYSENRKRRLEMSVSGFRTYVPMYVEIKRNNTKTPEGKEN